MKRNTISLEDFADFYGELHGVEMRASLELEPYVPSEDVVVDLGHIARAARIGRIGSVHIGRHSVDQSTGSPIVSGINTDGSATATFAKAATKSRRVNSKMFGESPLASTGSSSISINFNHESTNEMNLHDAKSWSSFLDMALREGLLNSGNKQLMNSKPERSATLILALGVGCSLVALDGGYTTANVIKDSACVIAGWNLTSFTSLGAGKERTLIPGMPLDRLSALQIYTRTQKFVKANKA